LFLLFSVYAFAGAKLPGIPGHPEVDILDVGKVFIHWAAPDSDGGSEINHYVIHYGTADMDFESFEKLAVTGDKTSCTISKRIKRNKEYKFAVAAENKVGVGPLSEFSEWIKITDLWGKRVQYLSLPYLLSCFTCLVHCCLLHIQ